MDSSLLYQLSLKIENSMDGCDDLAARAGRGDTEAFGLIFAQHNRFIYQFIYAMVGDQNIAEELTQETFFCAFKGIGALRGESKLRTWLCGIAKNIVYKHIRSHRRRGAQSEDAIESLNLVDEKSQSPVKQVLARELNQAISAALGNLDEDKRLIFTLKELQHLSYNEISEITGFSIPKLKTGLHRAKAEMKNALRAFMEVNDEL
jgi:RNA polymerase sigma-70 factor (ECF subfamily)